MMDVKLTDAGMKELREAFFAQAGEILDSLPHQIMALEKNNDEENWKAIKRSFHTLKGDSKAMGFDRISTFTHKVEDLIVNLKGRDLDRESIDLLLECTDSLGMFLGKASVNEEPDISGIVSRIDSHTKGSGSTLIKSEPVRTGELANKGLPFLRIEPERIDRIMNLVGELVIGRSMFSQITSEIDTLTMDSMISRLENLNSSFERTVSDLQRSVMKVRMIPVDIVFRRYPRIVRDLSAEKGKVVKLQIDGEKTELDKAIVDIIGEPLLHIVRNSIDHGIETPEERRMSGKPEEGLVCLRAFHRGNQMVIEVEDDGRGIDADRLKEKAVGKSIVSSSDAERMSYKDAINLIFVSGFSTADTVTEISGRGVGMDIVKEAIESLRGIIDISAEKGKGTKFTISLPLTLAIIKSILFSFRNDVFAFPLTSVTEIIRIMPDDIETMSGMPVLNHRKGVLPLVSLDGVGVGRNKCFVIVIGIAEMRAGLVAEKIIGEEELVIKALDGNASTGLAAGASILGDGKVVLIIDPLFLIKRCRAGSL